MIARVPPWLCALLMTTLLSAWMILPQPLHFTSTVINHHDSFFSLWRLGWIAHALATSPRHLLDGNVFHPASDTLTFSDATLLEGLLGAPLLWAGLPSALCYNLLLMTGLVGSGMGMYVLARYLTGSGAPAVVAAAAFTVAPYRIDHLMHLELQWVMWTPLAFWALHRAVAEGSWRFGAAAGLFVWLQIISCVYYGVFLAMLLVPFVPMLVMAERRADFAVWRSLAIGGLLAAVLTLPYALPYIHTAASLGGRDMRDVVRYSAQPIHYLATTPLNRLWGWTGVRWGGPEVCLFPGAVVIALTAVGWLSRPRRWFVVYAILAVCAIELSFGIHSSIYRWLFDHVAVIRGLRASARMAIMASCAASVLAAFGAQWLMTRGPAWRIWVLPIALLLLSVESSNHPLQLTDEIPRTRPAIFRMINSAGPGVIVELPLPTLDRLPGNEATYAFWSTLHWHPLVNGYSGYYPPDYVRTLVRMTRFPDDASIAWLRQLNVRYIVVHREYLTQEIYTRLMLQIATRPDLKSWGMYQDPVGMADLFVLDR